MADYDPNALPPYAVPPPTAEWGDPWAWLPPLTPPALPVDTVLVPPPGSNDRLPGGTAPTPPPEPPPTPQEITGAPAALVPSAAQQASAPPAPGLPVPTLPAAPEPGVPFATTAQETTPPVDPFAAMQQVTELAGAEADKVRQQRAWAPFVTEALDQPIDNFTHWLGSRVGAKVYETTPEVLQQARTAQRAAMYAADPDTLAIVDAKRELAAEDEAATKQLDAAKANRARAERDEANWRSARQRADANFVKREAEAKAIADSGWADGSTGKLIGGLLAAVAGAIYQTRNGGPNVALEAMERAVDRDAAMARDKMAVAQQRHGADLAQADQDLQTETSFRLAAYDRINEQILAEQQKYDPRGQTASRLAQMSLALQARKAAVARQAYDQDLKDQIALLEIQGKGLENVGKGLANEKALRKLAGIGGGGGGIAGTIDATGQPAFANLPPEAVNWSPQKLKAFLEARKADLDLSEKLAGQQIGMPGTGETLKQKDGTPWRGATADIHNKWNAATQVAEIIDEVLAIRDRSGGESSWSNSDDYQRLKVLEAQVLTLVKGGTQGMSSDEDMRVLKDAVGAGDVTSFRSRAAGLSKGRQRTMDSLNRVLRTSGYTGDRVDFRNHFDAPSRERKPDETAFSDTLHQGGPTLRRYVMRLGDIATGKVTDPEMTPEQAKERLLLVEKRGNGDEVKAYAGHVLLQTEMPAFKEAEGKRTAEYNKIRAAGGQDAAANAPDAAGEFFEFQPDELFNDAEAAKNKIVEGWKKRGEL